MSRSVSSQVCVLFRCHGWYVPVGVVGGVVSRSVCSQVCILFRCRDRYVPVGVVGGVFGGTLGLIAAAALSVLILRRRRKWKKTMVIMSEVYTNHSNIPSDHMCYI